MNVPSQTRNSVSEDRLAFVVLCLGFVLTGVVTVLIGQVLPVFINRWGMSDQLAGFFFTTQFLGSLLGTLLSSVIVQAKGFRYAIVLGFLMIVLGVGALNTGSKLLAFAAVATYGGGYGLVVPGTNLWVAENSGHRSAAALNVLNLAWGIGAVSCPGLILFAIRTHSLSLVLYLIAAVAAAISVSLLYTSLDSKAATAPVTNAAAYTPDTSFFIVVALSALFFVYVGNETGISGWAAAFAKRLDVPGGTRYVLAPTFFFAALLGGRGLASFVLLRVKEHWVAIFGLVLAAAGNFTLLRSTSVTQAIASVTVIGFGLSSLYPIYIAWLSKWFGARARKVGGVLFSFGALGGAIPPWLVGIVSTHAGGLQYGLLVPLVSSVLMLLIVGMLRKQFQA